MEVILTWTMTSVDEYRVRKPGIKVFNHASVFYNVLIIYLFL